ncbi:hypothetical protein LINPERHAP1_LOCUS9009, partial [Linum perenne]
ITTTRRRTQFRRRPRTKRRRRRRIYLLATKEITKKIRPTEVVEAGPWSVSSTKSLLSSASNSSLPRNQSSSGMLRSPRPRLYHHHNTLLCSPPHRQSNPSTPIPPARSDELSNRNTPTQKNMSLADLKSSRMSSSGWRSMSALGLQKNMNSRSPSALRVTKARAVLAPWSKLIPSPITHTLDLLLLITFDCSRISFFPSLIVDLKMAAIYVGGTGGN